MFHPHYLPAHSLLIFQVMLYFSTRVISPKLTVDVDKGAGGKYNYLGLSQDKRSIFFYYSKLETSPKAYIQLQPETIRVEASPWFRPLTQDFSVGDTNILVSKNPFEPYATPCLPNAIPNLPKATPIYPTTPPTRAGGI